jgi:hypothetical protein
VAPDDQQVLTWRISELERQLDQLRHDMKDKYLTSDQTELHYITRKELRDATTNRREYILYLVAIGQLALGLYIGLH